MHRVESLQCNTVTITDKGIYEFLLLLELKLFHRFINTRPFCRSIFSQVENVDFFVCIDIVSFHLLQPVCSAHVLLCFYCNETDTSVCETIVVVVVSGI